MIAYSVTIPDFCLKYFQMPAVSQKGLNMPESPIRKLVPFAEAAKKRGAKVLHLNIGQPDIKTPQVALDAVKNNTIDVLAYSRTEGSETYRKKLAAYYAKNDIHVAAEDIIVTTGGSEALSFVMGSIAERLADAVIVTNDNPRTEDPDKIFADIREGMKDPDKAYWEHERDEAIRRGVVAAGREGVVVIAGKGHETYQINGTDRRHFDDREVVRSLVLRSR